MDGWTVGWTDGQTHGWIDSPCSTGLRLLRFPPETLPCSQNCNHYKIPEQGKGTDDHLLPLGNRLSPWQQNASTSFVSYQEYFLKILPLLIMIIPLRFTLVEHFFIGSDKYMTDLKTIGIIEQECAWSMLVSFKNKREGGSFKEVKMPSSIFNFKSPLGIFFLKNIVFIVQIHYCLYFEHILAFSANRSTNPFLGQLGW